MQIDKYTKFLLTLIACCLVYLCLKDGLTLPKVQAQTESTVKVMLVDSNEMPIAGIPGSIAHPLSVRIQDR